MRSTPERGPNAGRVFLAWAVHLLTASGAVWGMLAVAAIADQELRRALAWMGLALLVDGVDGTLARRVGISDVLPSFDGSLLDNLVDYLNYAFVPAFLLYAGPILPQGGRIWAAALVCLAAAYQFARADAKPGGMWFQGFPSYWNVVVFYLLLLRPHPLFTWCVLLVLALLSFLPFRWVYPSRTPFWRSATLGLTALWGAALCALVYQYPETDPRLLFGSLAYVAYYAGASLLLAAAADRRVRRDGAM
jgi:phosphatidylcholine synthase